jgi:hypothetical protein
VRAFVVVVTSPSFDHDLCFLETVEDIPVEELIAELTVKALNIAVLPGTARLDVSGLSSDGCDSFSDHRSNKLGAIIRTDADHGSCFYNSYFLAETITDAPKIRYSTLISKNLLALRACVNSSTH